MSHNVTFKEVGNRPDIKLSFRYAQFSLLEASIIVDFSRCFSRIIDLILQVFSS